MSSPWALLLTWPARRWAVALLAAVGFALEPVEGAHERGHEVGGEGVAAIGIVERHERHAVVQVRADQVHGRTLITRVRTSARRRPPPSPGAGAVPSTGSDCGTSRGAGTRAV